MSLRRLLAERELCLCSCVPLAKTEKRKHLDGNISPASIAGLSKHLQHPHERPRILTAISWQSLPHLAV